MRFLYLFFLCLLAQAPRAQQSTFDTDNDDWGAEGDPVSTIAGWAPEGGMPGGHIRVTDAATGGTWFFTAPAKFRGNKCGAYDKLFSYDQFTSDTSNQITLEDRPDVEIWGNGQRLVFNNPNNPGLAWTHYEMLLREDAGWRFDDVNGPVPTEAEFRMVLSNITKIRIRGEYRPSSDYGGLDNIVLQNNFEFDLDADNSSGAPGADFASDTLCTPEGAVADVDALLLSELRLDSLVVRMLGSSAGDLLNTVLLPASISVSPASTPTRLVLINNGNASNADFIQALLAVRYQDISDDPLRGERLIGVQLYTECGDMGIHFAYLPVFPPPDAGLDGDTVLCSNSGPLDLRQLLGGSPDAGGYWLPKPAGGGNSFDPKSDAPGVFQYIIPPVGTCPGDTAAVTISLSYPPLLLPADTTLCYGDSLLLNVPDELLEWQWSDGSSRRELLVTEPGTYQLRGSTEYCDVDEDLAIDFYTCEPCAWYAPNIFSPNDDGYNDRWRIFLPCLWQRYRLEVFDRWGNLVFAADDPETEWDVPERTKNAGPGVYIWRLEWVGELFGAPQTYRASGDVSIVK